MLTSLYVHYPLAEGTAAAEEERLADAIVAFLAPAAAFVADETSLAGLYLAFELAAGEDAEGWLRRLRDFLARLGAGSGAYVEVLPPEWQPGVPRRLAHVHGPDRWVADEGH